MLEKNCHITIPKIAFPQVYADLMGTFKHALIELGVSVTESTAELRHDCLNVIFAPWGLLFPENLSLLEQVESLAEQCALFNMEQPKPDSPVFPERMVHLMQRTFNFDYYPEHIAEFQRAGCAGSTIRFLWHPSIKRDVIDNVERDIDILFIGSITPRRGEILSRLERDFDLKIAIPSHVWGRELDAVMARSKIAINIKGNEGNPSFEVLRCLPMIAYGAVVVSESKYENIYPEVKGMVDFCDLDGIGEQCRQLLQNSDLLAAKRKQQYAALVQTSFLTEVQSGWTDWMQWLSEPLNRIVVGCYDQLNVSWSRSEKWRYDTLYMGQSWSTETLDFHQPLRLESLERYVNSESLNMNLPLSGFSQIETDDSFARMADPIAHMQAWAELLATDGKMLFSLPYYLSPIAYDYPTYQRPYSESSLKSFVGKDSIHFLASNAYLDLECQSFRPTDYGTSLLKSGTEFNIAVHTPNAISHVEFVLIKRIRITE